MFLVPRLWSFCSVMSIQKSKVRNFSVAKTSLRKFIDSSEKIRLTY